ncbi:MAG: biosynthetic-type acetolactate synthase large subunit [Ruminococcus sp.]|nr:biosynthetic-type acetolactate synthase large subunit [Ruminococcus sp.]MBR4622807.1 biosynthetic-type acetolactate synthase large subunit [Ruminococcus sp.]
MRMKAAQAMVECLKAEGISTVYGYPGAAICPFYDALLSAKDDITHVLVRHEANGGHAANGFARISGKPAVCIATSGPGAVNLLTAIATAYADSIPLICITGQVNTDQIGSDAFQEADITGSAEPLVKHSYLIKNAEDLPRAFKEAFFIAGTGRPGPVLLDVPMDVQNTVIDFKYPASVDIRSYKPTTKGNNLQIKRVLDALKKAKKPLICIGGGVFNSNAQEEINKLAHIMNIPVITTMMGISVFSDDDPLFFGMLGMHGVKSANYAVNECDVLFLVGARVGDRSVRTPLALEKNTKILHIDIDPAEIGKNIGADLPLVGDAKTVLSQMLEKAEPMEHEEWLAQLDACRTERKFAEPVKGTVNPREFILKLSKAMPQDTVVVADVGQNQIWTATGYHIGKGGRFMTSGGMGTMGYSLPAAIGAKMAAPERTVIAVCGDGSFQMAMAELATAVQHGVNVKVVIMTNGSLGMVRELQQNFYDGRETAVALDGSPDFIKIAEAYGIKAMRVTDDASAEEAICLLSKNDGITLVEVKVDPKASTL